MIFIIASLLIYKAMWLDKSGQRSQAIEDGILFRDERIPVNISGRLKAKEHRIGAVGVSMHIFSCLQLEVTAGDMHINNSNLGAVFNMNVAAVANYFSILERFK